MQVAALPLISNDLQLKPHFPANSKALVYEYLPQIK